MAHAPRESGGAAPADFVRNVVSDPKNVPDVMLLTGYPGASSEEAHERLYLSADLSSYVEIPRTAILHQAAVPSEQDSNGAITVWVRKDAALQYKMSPAAQAIANYFVGAIQAGAQGAGAGYGAVGGIQPTPTAIPTHYLICQPTRFQPQCPYPSEICTHVGACPTRHPGYCPLPAGGPALRPTVAASCAPCLTHAVTCAPCHTVGETVCLPCTHLCTRVGPGCGGVGTHAPYCHVTQGDCTYFCGQSLACSAGLLCAGAAPRAAVCAQGSHAPQTLALCPTQHPIVCSLVCETRVACSLVCRIPWPQDQAADMRAVNARGVVGGSYAEGCWFSWNACPSLWGAQCGPHGGSRMVCQTQLQAADPVAQPRAFNVGAVAGVGGSYAPGCWYSFDACPSMICHPFGTHNTPCCPM
jgi:hypothetical protein